MKRKSRVKNFGKKLILILCLILLIIVLFVTFYNCNVGHADTIIVLGRYDSTDIMEHRVLNAISLCDNGTKFIIFSGGNYTTIFGLIRIPNESEKITEAKIMKELYEKNNKKCNATLVLEENSVNTLQNALNSIKIMKGLGSKYALVTSSKSHLHAYPAFYLAKIFSFSKIKFSIYLN